ncbi:MAG: hypothetical protein ABI430_02715 [Candidatus Taylorbacteria bacterium]
MARKPTSSDTPQTESGEQPEKIGRAGGYAELIAMAKKRDEEKKHRPVTTSLEEADFDL